MVTVRKRRCPKCNNRRLEKSSKKGHSYYCCICKDDFFSDETLCFDEVI